jgi:hypothetical protein
MISKNVANRKRPTPLVDANFAAELETLVLTAGHDTDLLAARLMLSKQ